MSLHVAAQHLASKGRNGDTELVHMTKGEIQSLQGLALAGGGSLSINPDTGLVEASFLKRMLPTIAGIGLNMMFPGSGALIGAGIGAFETARTGDIGKGLMAGLGAYGGANIAQGLAGAGAGAANTSITEATLSANPGVTANEIGREMVTPGFNSLTIPSTMDPATMTMADKMSAGFNQVTSSPQALGQFGKQNLMNIGAAAAPMVGDALTPKGPEMPGAPEEEERYKGSPYRYNLASNFTGATPARPNPYYRPTGLGYAEGGNVKKEEAAAAPAPQTRSELGQNFVKGALGEPRLKAYQVTDPMTQVVPYLMGAKMRSIMPEEIQDKMAEFLRPAAAPSGVMSSGIPAGYVIDRVTGQLVPMNAYNPSGVGYQGYAAGGLADDEPMGDDTAMASGGIAAYAGGGSLRMKTMSLGEGIARDNDTDTASLGAYDAAMKRLEKQHSAANLKARAMPKTNMSKLGEIKTGIAAAAGGSIGGYSDGGRMLKGPGDGMSDSIPATIGRKQPARLADGEFVVPADVVSHLGNGSTDAGAKRLYSMMDRVRKARTGKKKQAPAVKVDKYMPA
jgi:hypothetical protein